MLLWQLYLDHFQDKQKKKKAKSHKYISESPVPLSATLLCAMKHLQCPLSLRLKPKGNDILIGNIRNETQPLHLLASRSQHMPFSWMFGWRDQGVDWFYPAWERKRAPNPSATFLTLLSHGTNLLRQRFVCCNRLFWISVVWFLCLLCLLLTPMSPLAPWLATFHNLPSFLHLLGSPTWKAGGRRVRGNSGLCRAFRQFCVIQLTLLWVGHILPKQPFIARMCSACQGEQLPHTFTALKALKGRHLSAFVIQVEACWQRENSMNLVQQS